MSEPVLYWESVNGGFISQPKYDTDAGIDLRSSKHFLLRAHDWAAVPTGVKVELPAGTVGFVCPRSGLAKNRGVTVLNSPGVIDEGYTGEIHVILVNHDEEDVLIEEGDRIAQLVITPRVKVELSQDAVVGGERGEKGFGSTGR